MAAKPPLHLLLYWHQHQPLYKDHLANRYEMPWVRLHATKDYFDMAAVLEEFPTIKANFNLVPSLLAQLDDYAKGQAQDRYLDVTLIPAAKLSADDRQFLLQNFFMAHWDHMIDPYPRYRGLLDKRGRHGTPESFSRTQTYFKEQDWRDLQTWFNLTWFDPWWREKDEFIKGLHAKGKHFTEEEKQTLIQKQLEICGQIVAKHKALQDKGQIEVTTTPFYHPILPLLCDSDAAKMALPQAALPVPPFRHPDDARVQIDRAITDYTARFGQPPQGLWPSEGSVSDEAVQLLMNAGIRWIATDENILAKSRPGALHRHELFQPYRYEHGGKSLHLFFRDHELSDAIGFVYATWDPQVAAKDFIKRLHQRRDTVVDPRQPCLVSVVLDGENCWEYYRDDGLPFLRALYGELAKDPEIITVRGSDYLGQVLEAPKLESLWSGSWINSNFAIWIGHKEDVTAWNLLSRTRRFLVESLQRQPELASTPPASQAWEEIYIAEGSDWFWWYGDDHSSANDAAFDYLFRKHLMNVYTLLGEPIPTDLNIPIKRGHSPQTISEPVDFITPTLDGKITSYFEWRSAGLYQSEASGSGTMQKAETVIRNIYYGFDLKSVYFRIDFQKPIPPSQYSSLALDIHIEGATTAQLRLAIDPEGHAFYTDLPTKQPVKCGHFGRILEFGIPLAGLQQPGQTEFHFSFALLLDHREIERWPADSKFRIPYPTTTTFAYNWQV